MFNVYFEKNISRIIKKHKTNKNPPYSVTYLARTVQNFAQGLSPNQSSESLEEQYPVRAFKGKKTNKTRFVWKQGTESKVLTLLTDKLSENT